MKNFTKLFAIAVVILGFSATSFGQVPTTFTARASVSPVATITSLTDLNFGAIGSGPGGTVTIPTDGGARTTPDGVILLGTSNGATGVFTVGGTSGQTVTLQLPADPIVLDGTVVGSFMTIFAGDLHVKMGVENEDVLVHTLTSSSVNVSVGGDLTVNAAQAAGTYTGTYDIIIALN